MTRNTTCQSTSWKPDPARILHHPPLSGDHQPACGWCAILQIEEASNFRWRRPQPAAGRAMVARRRHPPSRSAPPERWSEGRLGIFFRAVESTLTLIPSAAAPRVLPKQP
ncbi:uncharacterized protein LOC119317163 isoform X2 [Triticum dicoccoides]|uniref:uncharacterized protein LOC119317163 isoform X2 n=1 Tax=Triticum dicoccoides TaxID=85692 RepID=UPI0018917165|nr:uncharacterized protein LOC119317163 isoform X2 [Triticum dicoccoides]